LARQRCAPSACQRPATPSHHPSAGACRPNNRLTSRLCETRCETTCEQECLRLLETPVNLHTHFHCDEHRMCLATYVAKVEARFATVILPTRNTIATTRATRRNKPKPHQSTAAHASPRTVSTYLRAALHGGHLRAHNGEASIGLLWRTVVVHPRRPPFVDMVVVGCRVQISARPWPKGGSPVRRTGFSKRNAGCCGTANGGRPWRRTAFR
jgi:hypothetical protein